MAELAGLAPCDSALLPVVVFVRFPIRLSRFPTPLSINWQRSVGIIASRIA